LTFLEEQLHTTALKFLMTMPGCPEFFRPAKDDSTSGNEYDKIRTTGAYKLSLRE
jgi:hypothetical protein